MRNFFAGLLAGLIVLVVVVGGLALGSWFVYLLLNVFLQQIGLGTVNIWGVLCLSSALYLIYKFIKL